MESKSFFDVWSNILLFDLLRYLIPAGLFFLIFWVFARKGLMHLFIQRTFPKSRQLWKEFFYSMSTIVIFSFVGYGIYSAEQAGLTLIYYQVSDYGVSYMIVSFVITLLFHDFYFYWTHRLMHVKTLFRHVHRVHHESTNPSPWAAYAFHPWEALIQAMVLPIMVFVLPLHPLTIFLFLAYMILRNVVGHLGFEILPKGFTKNKWCNWNTSITHHNMHHEHFHSNYGLYFTWWDRWMKTEDVRYHETFDEVKARPRACELRARKPMPKFRPPNALIFLMVFASSALPGQTIEGAWMTYNEATKAPLSIIEITKAGASIEGRVSQVLLESDQGEDPICSKCTSTRKDQKVIGMNVLWGFRRDGDSYSTGRILDPQSGAVYVSRLWLRNDSTLQVRGYTGPFDLLYRTQEWKREGPSSGSTPVGIWRTIDDHWGRPKSVVEIRNVQGELRGYVQKLFLMPHEGTDPICTECKGELKGSKIVGMRIMWDFKQQGREWVSGKILDPANGSVYASSLWLIDSNTLRVRGYLGPFFRSQIWKRVTGNR